MKTLFALIIKRKNSKKVKIYKSKLTFRLEALSYIERLKRDEELIIIDNTYDLRFSFRKINGKFKIMQIKTKSIKTTSALNEDEFSKKIVNYLDSCQSFSCTIEDMIILSKEK